VFARAVIRVCHQMSSGSATASAAVASVLADVDVHDARVDQTLCAMVFAGLKKLDSYQ